MKKIQHLAFTEKVKVIDTYVPEKVKIFIENNLEDDLKYFKKKYSFEVKILSNEKFIIPEYKIELLNKSKKLINIVENINSITQIKKFKDKPIKSKKEIIKGKEKSKKVKLKKKIRTLWVRRNKKKLN